MRLFLCGWFGYMAVLAALMTASAGTRTSIGKLAAVATAVAVLLVVSLYRWPFGNYEIWSLAAEVFVLLTAVLAYVAAPRSDTRHIALLLAAASALPVALHFWQPGA